MSDAGFGRRLRWAREASSLCSWEEAKRGRYACTALPAAHFDRNETCSYFGDSVTGQCRLTGFGIASRLQRERQLLEPPEFIAGTLAYMAPEQTGWMNSSIDSRSDLYALGVTLYEIVTGSLPFTVSDPMEWVHCHIARQAVPPSERRSDVPPTISAIMLKLLSKTAEDRYAIESMTAITDRPRVLQIRSRLHDLAGRPAILVAIRDSGVGLGIDGEARVFEALLNKTGRNGDGLVDLSFDNRDAWRPANSPAK